MRQVRLRSGDIGDPIDRTRDAFAAITTALDWSIVVFCGFAQQTGFLKVLETKCSGGAQRTWWLKENQDVGANKALRHNVLEAGIVTFHMADLDNGEQLKRKPWMIDFDMANEALSRANVFQGYGVVKQPFRHDAKVVCAHQKPQHLLM
ncbi:hypothetical protein CYMTET_45021 [Cymbomonas tetramitiformis]|uniref:Uncharacterized protein n=1 Tax=Cymbomonas tetramitiformis TaxID=36881 RepID=A0AAE0EYG2_9CHLO|nr:hypothetical protein CYMTET_45021 [Cymbomonas tetramitiformis]